MWGARPENPDTLISWYPYCGGGGVVVVCPAPVIDVAAPVVGMPVVGNSKEYFNF